MRCGILRVGRIRVPRAEVPLVQVLQQRRRCTTRRRRRRRRRHAAWRAFRRVHRQVRTPLRRRRRAHGARRRVRVAARPAAAAAAAAAAGGLQSGALLHQPQKREVHTVVGVFYDEFKAWVALREGSEQTVRHEVALRGWRTAVSLSEREGGGRVCGSGRKLEGGRKSRHTLRMPLWIASSEHTYPPTT